MTNELQGEVDVCALHMDFVQIMTGVGTDVKWLLRLGYAVTGLGMTLLTVVAPLIFVYFGEINQRMNVLRADVAVHERQLQTLKESDSRSEADRLLLHAAVDGFRQELYGRPKP